MESLYLSARIIFPIFTAISLGYLLRRVGLWGDQTIDEINTIVFKVMFPLTLFSSVVHTDLSQTFQKDLMICAAVFVLVEFFGVLGITWLFVRDRKRLGALVQGIFRGNTLLFGLPLVTTLYGEGEAGTAALMIAMVIPLYNALTVTLLEICRGGRVDIPKILKGIITNPLIVGTLAGVVGMLCGLQLPGLLDDGLSSITKINTPLALMALGGTFRFAAVGPNRRALSAAVLARLVLVPLTMLPVAIALGFRQVELASLISILAVPTAVSSFTMAQKMESDSVLAGQIVVFTSLCSVVTIFFWIFGLSQFGYL